MASEQKKELPQFQPFATASGFLTDTEIDRLLTEHASGQADNSRQIWCLMTLGLWLERYGARREVPYPLPG